MATRLQLLLITIALSFCFSRTSSTSIEEEASASPFFYPPPSPSPLPPQELQDSVSPTDLFEPILTNLGFQELAMAVPSLSDSAFAFTAWNGPSTIFAPTDASIRSCSSCSVSRLLREHIVPGIFSLDYLRSLAFGTKVETMSPGRCMTVTSADNFTKIFIGGVEITHPDLFNNGLIVVHGLQGFISHLSSFSCSLERMTSLSFPPQPSASDPTQTQTQTQSQSPSPLMRLMLRDAMLRLRNSGFTILSLALRVKYAELVNLQNMTLFALSDASIFSGGHAYVSNVRFHIVPNRLLMKADLEKLPAATSLATLERGERLVVTTAGGGSAPMRINYVPINGPDVMHNIKMVVHSVFLPFPHLHPAVGFGGVGDESSALNGTGENERVVVGPCAASDTGGCAVLPTSATTVTMEDHHSL